MKNIYYRLSGLLFVLMLFCSCVEEMPDHRERDYGYVQFKLYKEVSYDGSRSSGDREIQYLSDVTKVKLKLSDGRNSITQTLVLDAHDAETAEFGLRSEKLRLLSGSYRILTYVLYDKEDQPVGTYTPLPEMMSFSVIAGGLVVHDLLADVSPRGKVRFNLLKDLSAFKDIPQTKAPAREYTFDEIKTATLHVRSKEGSLVKFEKLPVKFSLHFEDNDDPEDGYRTSSAVCDTLLSLRAGSYVVEYYEFYDQNKILLEKRNIASGAGTFTIEDNRTTEADVKVALYESDEYIRDYYALYEIWKSLNGETWFYTGENFVKGVNWDFNKDPDLWGDQPGVELHDNGRVASINISDFAFSGVLPAAISQLTELVQLYLGTHNDTNVLEYDPTLSGKASERMAAHKRYLSMIHPEEQMSEPIAVALAENGISIPAVSMYEDFSEKDIFDMSTGRMRIRPMDMVSGRLCNGLESIDPAIGELENLEMLFIANGELSELPSTIADLKSLTDLELYNCPKMTRFPEVIAQLENLVSLNLSNNRQWSSQEINRGLDAIANGKSKGSIQILYVNENNLTEVRGESIANMKSLGLLDLSDNKISKIGPFGKDVNIIQLYLDNNQLESLPHDNGVFCGMDDVETFSVANNRLTLFPNIFSSKSKFKMNSVNFSYNKIEGFEGEDDGTFNGINVGTLSITNNPGLKKYPKCLADSESIVEYVNLRCCGLEEVPVGSFKYENAKFLVSLDLSYNSLSDLPSEFNSLNMPYFYGIDLSYNRFTEIPTEPFDSMYLTVYALRGQRDASGQKCMEQWPTGIYQHTGLRGLYLGSNNIGVVNDVISSLIYYLDISDNPEIVIDVSDVCYAIQVGAYVLFYDKSQKGIKGCDVLFN